jgi:hypothetical protein
VVLGNSGVFKAEHSDVEPRLVFLKPTASAQGETNALITTKTGREISLHLVSTETRIPEVQLTSFSNTTTREAFSSSPPIPPS